MKKILKKLKPVWDYKLISLALAALVAGLILQAFSQASAARWVLGAVSVIELLPITWEMWQDVRAGRYGVNLLAVGAVIAGVILKQDWAAIVMIIVTAGSGILAKFGERHAKSEIDFLAKREPKQATVIRKGKTITVKVTELNPGDKIVIEAGQVVPADAVIIEGSANLGESLLTGDSSPVSMQAGDQILCGSSLADGSVTARVTAAAEDSQYRQIVRLLRGASSGQAPFIRLAELYSLPFSLLAFGVGVGAWVLSGQAIRFLEVIIVATPVPLLLAAPIALSGGMSRASRYGVIFKTGKAFEKLATVRVMMFNQTGTLTHGRPEVNQIRTFGSHTQAEVLQLAAGLEQGSRHAAARAIVMAATAQKVKTVKIKNVNETPGRGLQADFKGRKLIAGSLDFLQDKGIELPAKFKQDDYQTAVYIGIGRELAGAIYLQDELRVEARATLESLIKMGVKEIVLLTGDHRAAAERVAALLQIGTVQAGMSPAEKVHAVEKPPRRPSVFVGDGVKDAPALAAAEVGVALGTHGTPAAAEPADIVILPENLSRIATALSLAKRSFKIARQCTLAGLGLSLALMAAFATGKFSPLEGVILQAIINIYVIANALRAHSITADI